MLRARAWVQEYLARSAKYTPEEKQQYMTELQNLTPAQMKLWLLKFDQEEESRQQQYAFWEQAHNAAMSRAMAADQATQKSYSAINHEENQAAAGEQQQLNSAGRRRAKQRPDQADRQQRSLRPLWSQRLRPLRLRRHPLPLPSLPILKYLVNLSKAIAVRISGARPAHPSLPMQSV